MGIMSALGFESGDGGAADSIQAGVNEWRKVQIPNAEELAYEIERYRLDEGLRDPGELFTGDLTMGDTGLKDIAPDQRVEDAQYQALGDVRQVAEEGITAQQAAGIADMQAQQGRVDRGAREAIMQNYRERGVGGAGGELAAQLMAQQAGADRMAGQGLDINAQARMASLNAMGMQGDIASRMRG
ncbi:hypothetical protein OAG36_01160, partial [bacterium]|nr:hypothetical protein [bacterium]